MIDVWPNEESPTESYGQVFEEPEDLESWVTRLASEGIPTAVGWAPMAMARATAEGWRGAAGVDGQIAWLQVPRTVPDEEEHAWIVAHRPPAGCDFIILDDPWRTRRRDSARD